ncbi:MAG: methionyl-tRNA formyltransferase [Synergistaceae bacterium]
MNIGFCGSGLFASQCLDILNKSININWVVTNTPKHAGRGMKLQETQVQILATKLNLECKTTIKISEDTELINWIKDQKPDLILVIDFGQMIKTNLLTMPTVGCINIHPSKLPELRGAAPLQRALMLGLTETYVTIFKLDEGMDSGPILDSKKIDISLDDDFETLLTKSAKIGSELLSKYILEVPCNEWKFHSQVTDSISYAPKIAKIEGRIDWNEPYGNIINMIRGIKNFPGVYTIYKNKRLRIFKAESRKINDDSTAKLIAVEDGYPIISCGNGAVKLLEVQPEGKKIQQAKDWLLGARLQIGDYI